MTLLAIYADQSSPLYDPRRDPAHQPPFPLDLDYNGTDPSIPTDQEIDQNLKIMYRQASTQYYSCMLPVAKDEKVSR